MMDPISVTSTRPRPTRTRGSGAPRSRRRSPSRGTSPSRGIRSSDLASSPDPRNPSLSGKQRNKAERQNYDFCFNCETLLNTKHFCSSPAITFRYRRWCISASRIDSSSWEKYRINVHGHCIEKELNIAINIEKDHSKTVLDFVSIIHNSLHLRFVTGGGPSVDKLMPGDQILSINGEDVARWGGSFKRLCCYWFVSISGRQEIMWYNSWEIVEKKWAWWCVSPLWIM